MIEGLLVGNKVKSNSHEAFALYDKAQWGEKNQAGIEYSLLEAITLVHLKKMRVSLGRKELSEERMLKKAKKQDKRVELKLAVFKDLRKKGYVVKTALKFGAEFRVYEKGVKPGQDHAPWLLFPVREHESLTWYDFAAKSRVATSTGKKLLLGIVDESNDVTYYQVNWTRP